MFRFLLLVFAAFWLSAHAQAQPIPALSEIPSDIAAARPALVTERRNLQKERDRLRSSVLTLNADCSVIDERNTTKIASCTNRKQELSAALAVHIEKSGAFNAALAGDESGRSLSSTNAPLMTERAAQLVKTFNDVAGDLNLPKVPPADRRLASHNCQAFFRGVAAALARQDKPSWEEDFPGMDADAIAEKLAEVGAAGGDWEEVDIGKVQLLANQGIIVVGASRKDDSGYGHLAFAFPTPATLDPSNFIGSGPFVRDGNVHSLKPETGHELAPSTWGAVHASDAFGVLSRTKWYAWVPSKP